MTSVSNRLERLMALPESVMNLAEAALVIAAQEYPEMEVDDYLARIAQTSDQLRRRLAADASRAHIIAMLNHLMFDELGYSGAEKDYYDPRNSYLNDVMERRVGIPITLSILYLAVGQRVGLPLSGVAFPGHFLVRCPMDGGIVVLDPFNRGVSVSESDLRARLNVQTDHQDALINYLQAASKKEILARLLRNLKAIFLRDQQHERALRVMNLMLVVAPDAAEEWLARALLHRDLECTASAARDLETYLRLEPRARERDDIQQLLDQLATPRTLLH